MTVTLGLENATSGTYSLDGSAPVAYTGSVTIRIGSDYNVGETINLTVTATDGSSTTSTDYKYTKKDSASSGIYIFFNSAKKSSWKAPYYVYIYDEDTSSEYTYSNASWPGQQMQYDEATGYYYIEVSATSCLAKDADGNITDSNFDLAHSSNTHVIISSTNNLQYPGATSKTKLSLGGTSKAYCVGTAANSWETTTLVPSNGANVEATDVTKGDPAPVTTAPTTTTTEPTTTAPATEVVKRLYGDVNGDGEITIEDVTNIQKHIAALTVLTGANLTAGDVDGDGEISIADATLIQKYIAAYADHGRTGETFNANSDKPETQPQTTKATTQTQTTTAAQSTSAVQPTTIQQSTDPTSSSTFYVPNYVSWLTAMGGKLWVYNDATAEFIVMDYDEDLNAFYVDLPEDWSSLSIYRTPFETEEEDFDINSSWNDDTQTGVILNKWTNLGDKGSYNSYKITGDGTGYYDTYDPNASVDTERTIYFDNSKTKWSTVYI
jgi:alpha-amylase